MSSLYDQQVQPYTRIEQIDRVGLSVEACSMRVGRFGFVAKQLMLVQAAKMSSTANWEFKAALGRQLWENAQHWGLWRERISELRGHEHLIERNAEGALNDFFLELLHSNTDAELAVGLYTVILPAYRAALERYTAETNPLVDQPTVRTVRHVLLDLDDQLTFGQSVLAAIVPTDRPALAVWQNHLERYLSAAGGLDGTGTTRPTFELPPPRHVDEFRIPGSFARDARFATALPKTNPYREDNIPDALLSKMWVRSQEMTAAELCATVLFEWEDLPYLAIATEAGAMRHPGGKRGEWEWCKEKAQHPLMTTYQDFDWADEVNHVAYGRKWLIRYFCEGDRKRAEAMADETVVERAAYYQQLADQATSA